MGRLIDKVIAEPGGRTRGCGLGDLIDTLNDDDRADLVELLNDPETYKSSAITRMIEDEFQGKIGYSTTLRHRRRQCLCGDDKYQ